MAYQKPSNPAPVSAPGALSSRTDGGPAQPIRVPAGGEYGDRTDMTNLQQGAPMEAAGGMPSAAPVSAPAAAAQQGQPVQAPTPFTAPTMRPDEPGTAGSPVGAGPGPEALGLGQAMSQDAKVMQKWLPVLEHAANSDPTFKSMRMFVQYLKGL